MADKNIVLIHGWGAKTIKLEPLKKKLEKLGWKVLLPKLAGFEKPEPKEVWGITEYSDYILKEARLKFKKKKYFVFGHSFGGGIAIKIASRKNRNVAGIILCASRGISRGKVLKRIVFGAIANAGKILLITPNIAESFRKILYKAAREHDYEKTRGIMKEIFKKIISEDLKPLLPKIKLPTLVLWGDMDKMTPINDANIINNTVVGSTLVVFKNQGHRLPYEKPNELAKEITKWQTLLH